LSQNVYTVALLKPDAVRRRLVGPLVSAIEAYNFRIVQARLTRFTPIRAGVFYEEHAERPYFDLLVDFMTSGPLWAMQLRSDLGGHVDVVSDWRRLMGPSNPAMRPRSSLRGRYAMGCTEVENLVHGSDSPTAAERELRLLNDWEML
jgi:nucleoside-diphosphate kinase